MAAVIEAEKILPPCFTPFGKKQGLGPHHVGTKTMKENDRGKVRLCAILPYISKLCGIRAL